MNSASYAVAACRVKAAVLILLFSMLCAWPAIAQLTKGTIRGRITDSSGAAVPGATVTAKNVETGVARKITSGPQGGYELPDLSVGQYEVAASLSGFQTSVRSGITLTVGQTAVVNHVLQVGQVQQSVTVTGQAAMVETTTATVSNLVNKQNVEDLPLNDRDLTQLTYLQPGVLRIPTSGTQGAFSGMGGKLSVAGARGTQNLYLLDGVNNGDLSNNAQGASSSYTGAETVQQFQIVTNNYSAKYPSVAGAIISAVTKSGTNSLHGSAFEFLRNDKLDAANFFTNSFGIAKPAFKRNQFGGSLGGPIVRDKMFFFGSYEGLRERLNEPDSARVPSMEARLGILPGKTVTVAPGVKPYLNLYPAVTPGNLVEDLGDGTVRIAGQAIQPTNDNFVAGKLDYNLSSNHQLSATYNFDKSERNGPFGILGPVGGSAGTGSGLESLRHIVGFGFTSVLSPSALNEFHLGFSDTTTSSDIPLSTKDWGSLVFSPIRTLMGEIQPDNFDPIGFRVDRSDYVQENLTFKDGLTLTRGNHTIQFGGQLNRFLYDQRSCSRGCNGVFQFHTLEDFLTAQPFRFQVMAPDAQGRGLSPAHVLTQWAVGTYFQDNWRASNSFTLNLGLRYEFNNVPGGPEANTSSIRNIVTDALQDIVIGPPYTNATALSFSPRFGFAWAPGDQKTSLRGGFAVFYVPPRLYQLRTSLQEMPPFVQVRRIDDKTLKKNFNQRLDFPNAYTTQLDLGSPHNNMRPIQYEQSNTYVYHWSLTLQREIGNWLLSAGYTGAHGLHLWNQNRMNLHQWVIKNSRDANAPTVGAWPDNPQPGQYKYFSADSPSIIQNFGESRLQDPNANSYYNGLAVGGQKRLGHGLLFQFAYTFSKTIDQGAGATSTGDELPQSQRGIYGWDMQLKRGLSSQDIRNSFSSNFSYTFPKGNFGGFSGAFINGWQVNGILTLTDGSALTVLDDTNSAQNDAIGSNENLRPDLIPGGNNNPVLGGPNQYFDPTQFIPAPTGFFGNLGAGTLTGPGLANFDLSLFKNFPVTESSRFQFRAEFFNLFNRANFQNPYLTVFQPDSTRTQILYDANAGKITSTRSPNREIQFALKFIF